MVTSKTSPPAFRKPKAYLELDLDAVWLISNERGVCLLKKALRICFA